MRVAFISTILGYPWGGPDKRWTLAARACLERGDEVFLGVSEMTANHPLVEGLVKDGARLELRRSNTVWQGQMDALKRRLPWRRDRYFEGRLRAFEPDVVFLLLGGTFDVTAEPHLVNFLQRKGIPYVASCSLARDGACINEESKASLQDFFRKASATLFMSSQNMQLANEQLGMEIPKAQLIQNPLIVSCDEAQPFPPEKDRPQLGFVGRIDIQHKGLDLLFEALGRVSKEVAMDLHLTGRCEDEVAFRELVLRYDLADAVHVHRYVAGGELLEAYCRAELVVLTSRWEGCASTMLEAMMVGRPQLVTSVGAVSDWLADGETAFIAEDVSVDSIEGALRRALRERSRWEEMGRAAREAFDQRRDPDPVGTLVGMLDGAASPR